MKIAIPSTGENINSRISLTFARAPYILIVDDSTNEAKAIRNPYLTGRGVGYAMAERMANEGVDAVVTNTIGPNALATLNQLGIKVYHTSGIIKDAIESLKNNKLSELTTASEPRGLGFGRRGGGIGRGAGFGGGYGRRR